MLLLMNHNRNFDKRAIKTKYAVFCCLIFFCFSIFSYQSVIVVNSSGNFNYTSEPFVSSDFSDVAYIASPNGVGTAYLVVTNLLNVNSASYKLCNANYCLTGSNTYSIYYFNKSTFLIQIWEYPNNIYYYFYNTITQELQDVTTKIFQNLSTNLFYIGNSIYAGDLEENYYNQTVFNFQDLTTDGQSTITLPNIQLNTAINQVNSFIVSPDFTKLAVYNGSQINFYELYNSQAILINSTINHKFYSLAFELNNINFLPWTDSSVVYFSNFNSATTYLDSFNYSSSGFKINLELFYPISISNVNTNYSYYITNNPVQIFSLKNNKLITKTSFDQGIWNVPLTKSICWNYNSEIKVVNFNPTTNSFTIGKTVDASLDSTVIQILNIIEYSNFICTLVLIVAIIVLLKKEKLIDLDYLDYRVRPN